jgi:hypothetical protein
MNPVTCGLTFHARVVWCDRKGLAFPDLSQSNLAPELALIVQIFGVRPLVGQAFSLPGLPTAQVAR